MICLNNTDTLEGGASVNAVVDYTVHGLVTAGTFSQIARGQLSNTDPTVLYTAAAATGVSIVSVVFVNTHSAAVTVNLYLDPANAGTPRRLIPKALSLGIGYSMHFDGQRCSVLDASGALVMTPVNVSDVAYNATTWDGVTTVAPSKNAVRDAFETKADAGANSDITSLAGLTTPLSLGQGGTGQATASAAFSALKQDATVSATGVVELATVAEAVAGTDTSRTTTAEGVHAAIAVDKNPLAFAQGINMTEGTSSNGIQVADNDNIDFGTGNFTLVWRGSLPDWTPSAYGRFIDKRTGATGYQFYLDYTQNKVGFYVGGFAAALFSASLSTLLVDDAAYEIVVVCTQATTTAVGSLAYFINGVQFGDTIEIPAGSYTGSSTASLYVSGIATARAAGTVHSAILYNRAMTAAQVLSLYRNGVDFSDVGGSQTEKMPNQVDRDFSGASAWADVDLVAGGGAYDEAGDLTITAGAAGANDYCTLPVASAPTTINKRYRMTYDLANLVGTWTLKDFTGVQTIGTISATATQAKIEWVATTTGGYRLIAVSNNASGDFDNFTLKQIGATVNLQPEGIQPAPGQCLDSSGNKLHAKMPAVGASLVRSKRDFTVKWTNTWAGTHEAQYISGINESVLPPNCYITSIIGVVAGATIEDIIVGDGSDTDRWVTITTGLAAGTVAFTIASPISDGTNYKLVVDPDANFTGSIAWTISGIIL